MAYLLDSDILIDMSRGNVQAGHYLNSLDDWSLSIVSGMELVAEAQVTHHRSFSAEARLLHLAERRL